MSRWELIHKQQHDGSLDLCNKLLGRKELRGERSRKPWRIAAQKVWLAAGEAHTTKWSEAYCEEDDETYRVNGHHTATSCKELFEETGRFPKIPIVYEEFYCKKYTDVVDLWRSFDQSGSVRTPQDNIVAAMRSCEKLAPISGAVLLLKAATGICYYAGSRLSNKELGEDDPLPEFADAGEKGYFALRYIDFILWHSALVSNKGNRKGILETYRYLTRSCVAAAMLQMWMVHPGTCKLFWQRVRDESSTDSHSADRYLSRWLQTRGLITGTVRRNVNRTQTKLVDDLTMRQACVTAWSSWLLNRPTVLKKPAGEEPVLETPTSTFLTKHGLAPMQRKERLKVVGS
jgi:hypothetical protein